MGFICANGVALGSQRLPIEDAEADLWIMRLYLNELGRIDDPIVAAVQRRIEAMGALILEARSRGAREVDIPDELRH